MTSRGSSVASMSSPEPRCHRHSQSSDIVRCQRDDAAGERSEVPPQWGLLAGRQDLHLVATGDFLIATDQKSRATVRGARLHGTHVARHGAKVRWLELDFGLANDRHRPSSASHEILIPQLSRYAEN